MTRITLTDDYGEAGTIVEMVCPKCGSPNFESWEGGNYTERHTISFDEGVPTDAREDWDKMNQDVMNSEPWQCVNEHIVPEDLANALEQWRGE